MKKILFFLLLVCIKQVNAQVCFTTATNYTIGGNYPQSLCSGDFNGDTKLDLAIANSNSAIVSILLGTGAGTFGGATNFATGNYPVSVITADFNGDAKLDLVVVNGNDNTVSILLGTGTGSFGARTNFAVGTTPYSATSADFNGDTKLDLVVSNSGSNSVSILLGNGAGSFAAATNFAVTTGPRSVCCSDFNGDAKTDLAVADYNAGKVSILLGTGTGSFGTPTTYTASAWTASIITADFNGDTKADLATGNGSNISIFLGTGTGTFGAAVNYGSGGNINSIVSADFNGDTKLDLAGADINSNSVLVLLGTGTGSFGMQTNFAAGTQTSSLCKGDFNGDSKFDLAATNQTDNNVSVLLNTALPLISISGSAAICTGDATTLTASGVSTYTWSTSATTATVSVSPTITTTYTVNGSDVSTGCTGVETTTVTVNPVPTLTLSATKNAVCYGDSTTLTVSGANTYTWTGSGCCGGSANSATVTVRPYFSSMAFDVYATDINGCTNASFINIIVNNPSTVTVNSPTTCAGSPVVLTGGGATSYTWSTTATTSTISVAPTGNASYTVTGTDANTCTNTAVSNVTVNSLPTLTITANASAICIGSTATLTATGSGAGSLNYSWTNGIINGVSFTPTITATNTVTVTDANNCSNTGTVSIVVNPLPTVTASSATVCGGSPAILTAGGTSTSYSWSTGANTATVSVSPTVTTTYTVTGTDVNACINSATGTVNAPANPMPYICMITADSLALNNIIYWDRTLYPQVDSFIVYRYDVFATSYLKIGAVKKDSSQFTDIERTIGSSGSNNGDPQYGSWRYKLAVLDTCGNISAKSPYHESVFVQENFQNFSWNAYNIEAGQSNPTTGYSFQRDDLNTGSWHVLINTAVTSATDPNYATFPNGNWRVEALGFSCTPTMFKGNNSTMGAIVKSKSNICNNRATKINQFANASNLGVYPNPSAGIFSIETNQKLYLQVFNVAGEMVLSQTLESGKTTIDASNLQAGIYNISLNSNAGVINKRLVIVK
jgi:ankyrin repeat protein